MIRALLHEPLTRIVSRIASLLTLVLYKRSRAIFTRSLPGLAIAQVPDPALVPFHSPAPWLLLLLLSPRRRSVVRAASRARSSPSAVPEWRARRPTLSGHARQRGFQDCSGRSPQSLFACGSDRCVP